MTCKQFVFWLLGYINKTQTKDAHAPQTGLKAHQWQEILKALRQVDVNKKDK